MSLEMTASSAADEGIRAFAWMLDTVFNIHFHPLLMNENGDQTVMSHGYVESIFDSCDSYIASTMKRLNLISFSMPKDRSSLRCVNAESDSVGRRHSPWLT
jgi:hypothetical protein